MLGGHCGFDGLLQVSGAPAALEFPVDMSSGTCLKLPLVPHWR